MTPSTMLPANEAVLKRRFPDAYIKIMQTGNRMPTSFYYEDTTKGPKLKIDILWGENIRPMAHKTKRNFWKDGFQISILSLNHSIHCPDLAMVHM